MPGTGAHVLHATLPGGQPLTIGVLICFESAFPDMSRVDADHGAQVIIYQTSDSTFAGQLGAGAARRAQRAARRRDRPPGRAGGSDRRLGRLRRPRPAAGLGRDQLPGVVLVQLGLPPASARTLYDRLGDYVPWTAVAIAALAALIGIGSGRSARRRTRPLRRRQPGGAAELDSRFPG